MVPETSKMDEEIVQADPVACHYTFWTWGFDSHDKRAPTGKPIRP